MNPASLASRLWRRGRCWWAQVSIAAIVLTGVAALTSPVAAATDDFTSCNGTQVQIYLAHYPTWGTYAVQGVNNGSTVSITSPGPWGVWCQEPLTYVSEDGISGESYQYAAVTSSNSTSDWCLTAANALSLLVILEKCGSGGTAWVPSPNGGGYLLFSRYYLNIDKQAVLSTEETGSNPAGPLYTLGWPASGNLGAGYYYRWGFNTF